MLSALSLLGERVDVNASKLGERSSPLIVVPAKAGT